MSEAAPVDDEWQAELDRAYGPPLTLDGRQAINTGNGHGPPDSDGPAPPDLFRTYSAADLAALELDFRWSVKGVLCDPTHAQVAGEMKTLKSYIEVLLLIAIASGEPLFGRFEVQRQGPVVLYVGEGGRIPFSRRLVRFARALGIRLADLELHVSFDVAPVGSLAFDESLARDLAQYRPVHFGLDPWYAYHGAKVEAQNLHQEGGHLNKLRAPVEDAGASLTIVNHFNQTGSGGGLKRITQSGSGEWVDSWILTSHRQPPNVADGEFQLLLEIGSRQWGGTTWELDLNIGRFDPDTGTHDGDITWDIRPADRTATRDAKADKIRSEIHRLLLDHDPYLFTRAQVLEQIGGNRPAAGSAFDHLADTGSITHDRVAQPEGDRMVTRQRWAAVLSAEPGDDTA